MNRPPATREINPTEFQFTNIEEYMNKIFFGLLTLTAGMSFANEQSAQLTIGELKMRSYKCDQVQTASFQDESVFFLSGLSFTDPKNPEIKIRANTDSVTLSDAGEIKLSNTIVGQIDAASFKNKIIAACNEYAQTNRPIPNYVYDVSLPFTLTENTGLSYRLENKDGDCNWVGVLDSVHSSFTGRTSESLMTKIVGSGGQILSQDMISVGTVGCSNASTFGKGILGNIGLALITPVGIVYGIFSEDSSPEAVASDMKD